MLVTCFLLPAVLYVCAWRIVPALYTVYLSFSTYNLTYDSAPGWMWFANYVRLATDGSLWASLRVTIEFTVIVTAAETGPRASRGAPLRPLPARALLGIFLVPMVMAPVVVGTIWYVLFDKIVGPIPYLIQFLHGPSISWLSTPGTALIGLVVANVWEWTPLMGLLLLSVLQAVSREMVEAARVDGASGLQVLRYVTLPQIAGMMAVSAGLRFMDAFRELDRELDKVLHDGRRPGDVDGLPRHACLQGGLQVLHAGVRGDGRGGDPAVPRCRVRLLPAGGPQPRDLIQLTETAQKRREVQGDGAGRD